MSSRPQGTSQIESGARRWYYHLSAPVPPAAVAPIIRFGFGAIRGSPVAEEQLNSVVGQRAPHLLPARVIPMVWTSCADGKYAYGFVAMCCSRGGPPARSMRNRRPCIEGPACIPPPRPGRATVQMWVRPAADTPSTPRRHRSPRSARRSPRWSESRPGGSPHRIVLSSSSAASSDRGAGPVTGADVPFASKAS